MTPEEEVISNISYTNSDFRTIYPQLLDTAKKLSNKWDPSLSNESDPGNILIKEAAIVADKNNYHVDKNILECFPLSATQQSSARQIYDLAGYNMHWYRSAVANISFTLTTDFTQIKEDTDADLSFVFIPAGTAVTDNEGEFKYTTVEPAVLSKKGVSVNASAIEGTIVAYELNSNNIITVDNLDENLRLYLPYSDIAQNGIFVCQNGTVPAEVGYKNSAYDNDDMGNFWTLVDNLYQYSPGSKIFKFGLDLDSDSCYIQFPEDIITSELIGSGLNIYYTLSSGAKSSVNTNMLTKFASDITAVDSNNNSAVVNPYIKITNKASTEGLDPETLEKAYNNYKRTIGTYNTLVSRRDYQNAIYNLRNDISNEPLISNGVVADRTSDINYSQKVIRQSLKDSYSQNFVAEESGSALIKPYEIILYLLEKPASMTSISDYENSFSPETDAAIKTIIDDEFNEYKAVQHDLKFPASSSDILFDITNVITLKGNISTYYKVTKTDANDIEKNIINKLISTYNSRNIDFGQDINYDELIEVIKSSDDRIRNVSLNTYNYQPTLKMSDNSTKDLYSTVNDSYNDLIVAKSVLAGKVQLFNIDDNFQLDFGQTEGSIHENISYIKTFNPISLPILTDKNNLISSGKTLGKNDIVQVITPNLNIKSSFEATVKYVSSFNCDADNVHVLSGDDKLKVIYVENGVSISKLFTAGTIIKPVGVALTARNAVTVAQWSDNVFYDKILGLNQSIKELDVSSISLTEGMKYYVITNKIVNDRYVLQLDADTPRILMENEYLLYADNSNSGVVILGSGTSIQCSESVDLYSTVVDMSDIIADTENLINVWEILEKDLTIVENVINTFMEGDIIAGLDSSASTKTLTNNLQDINGFAYKLKDEADTEIKEINKINNLSSYTVKIRSNMILDTNSQRPQLLIGEQVIQCYNNVGTQIDSDIESGDTILSNYPLQTTGGDYVDTTVIDETTGENINDFMLYSYKAANPTSISSDTRVDDILTVPYNASAIEMNFTFEVTGSYEYYILPITTSITAGETITFTVDNGKIGKFIDIFNDTATTSLTLENSEDTCLAITATSGCKLTVTISGSNDAVMFKYMKKLSGLNTTDINSDNVANNNAYSYHINEQARIAGVMSAIETLPGNEYFDWSYKVPDSSKVLQPISGEAYFNINHVLNNYTISKIDFKNSSIKVNSTNII